jgi:hypothetical protein
MTKDGEQQKNKITTRNDKIITNNNKGVEKGMLETLGALGWT